MWPNFIMAGLILTTNASKIGKISPISIIQTEWIRLPLRWRKVQICRVSVLRPNFFSRGLNFWAGLAEESWRNLAAVSMAHCSYAVAASASAGGEIPWLRHWYTCSHFNLISPVKCGTSAEEHSCFSVSCDFKCSCCKVFRLMASADLSFSA